MVAALAPSVLGDSSHLLLTYVAYARDDARSTSWRIGTPCAGQAWDVAGAEAGRSFTDLPRLRPLAELT